MFRSLSFSVIVFIEPNLICGQGLFLQNEQSKRLKRDDFYPGGIFPSADWFVIITVWIPIRISSSSIEYRLARLYNSFIVAGGSKDSDRKK